MNDCQIRIAVPENPRSWSYQAYDHRDWISLEFAYPYRGDKCLYVECEESGSDYEYNVRLGLTLPQAKKMKEFLEHFISVEELNG